MQKSIRSALLRYGGAFAAVILATVGRLALDPVLGDSKYSFGPLFLAVLVVAGTSGRGPALLTVGLGVVALAQFLLPPRVHFSVLGFENQTTLVVFVVIGVGIALLGGALRAARQRAEDAANEAVRQREQLRLTLNSIGDAVLVTDAEGRVTSMNPVAEALTGWPSSEAAGQPITSIFKIINESNRSPVESPVLRALREGDLIVLANHTFLISKDGTERPIDNSASPIRDASGRVVGCVLVFRDMSEKKRTEAAIQQAGEQARTILESITDAFCALDRDWHFVYANRQSESLLRRNREDLLGKNHWEEYPDTIGTDFERNYRRAMAVNVAVTFETFYPPHDRWYEVHAYPSPNGLSIYFRDVTERKRSDEKHARLVAQSEQQRRTYETALSNTPDFHYIFDLEGRFSFVNASLLALLQNDLHEVVGKDFFELGYPPELAARLQRQIRQVIETGQPVRDETPFTSHLGERQYEYIFVPVLGSAGAIEAVVGSTRDITERKRAEENLREHRELLRVTLASVGDAVVTTDLRGSVTFLNAVAESLTGWKNEEAIGRPLAQLIRIVNEESRQPVEDRAAKALREGAAVGLANHSILIARDGTETPIEDNAAPIRDEEGRVSGVVLVFRDVAERRATERNLRRNEERLRLFVEHAPAAVAMLDREMRYLLVSRRWQADFGLEHLDPTGRSHYEVMPDTPDRWREVHRRCLAGAVEQSDEDLYLRAAGREEWVRWEVRPWSDDSGKVGGIIIFSEIITEQKRTRRIVQEHAETLSGILSATVDHIYVLDRERRYTHVSAGGARVLGFKPNEMAGKHWSELGLPAEIMAPVETQFERVLLSGLPA